MKTIYVVYDHNEMPFEKYESLEDAYWWAMGCWDDYWYPVFIDKFERHDRDRFEWHCENNDLWYMKKWEWRWMDCVEEDGIKWYGIVRAETKEELKLYDTICLTCDLTFKRKIDI